MTDQIYKTDALISRDIDAYLESPKQTAFRFITCGSVDDDQRLSVVCFLTVK